MTGTDFDACEATGMFHTAIAALKASEDYGKRMVSGWQLQSEISARWRNVRGVDCGCGCGPEFFKLRGRLDLGREHRL
jgi:hypothetical protein